VRAIWRASECKQNKQGAWCKHDPGGAKLKDELYDAYLITKMDNVRGIAARSGFKGRQFIFGLTADPKDDHNYESGYWLEIRSDGAYRKGDYDADKDYQEPPTKLCTYDMEDVLRISIYQGAVSIFKNDEHLHTIGPASQISMYGKIFLYHKETLVEILADFTIAQVTDIDMNSNWIGDNGAIRLMKALGSDTTRVWKLDLGVNRIGDIGAKVIAETLELERCCISWLNLSHNDIRDEGVIRLAEALEHQDCIVTVIWLNDNDILDAGAIRIAEALEQESCFITSIELAHNRIKDDGIVRIAEALEHEHCKVTHVALDGNRNGPNGRLRWAETLANATRLEVGCEDDW